MFMFASLSLSMECMHMVTKSALNIIPKFAELNVGE